MTDHTELEKLKRDVSALVDALAAEKEKSARLEARITALEPQPRVQVREATFDRPYSATTYDHIDRIGNAFRHDETSNPVDVQQIVREQRRR
jgi:hypothetical protein